MVKEGAVIPKTFKTKPRDKGKGRGAGFDDCSIKSILGIM